MIESHTEKIKMHSGRSLSVAGGGGSRRGGGGGGGGSGGGGVGGGGSGVCGKSYLQRYHPHLLLLPTIIITMMPRVQGGKNIFITPTTHTTISMIARGGSGGILISLCVDG